MRYLLSLRYLNNRNNSLMQINIFKGYNLNKLGRKEIN